MRTATPRPGTHARRPPSPARRPSWPVAGPATSTPVEPAPPGAAHELDAHASVAVAAAARADDGRRPPPPRHGSRHERGRRSRSRRRRGRRPARERPRAAGRNGHAPEPPAGCTAPQLRRFIKSRPYVPMHELRRRFGIDGGEDDVTPVDLGDRAGSSSGCRPARAGSSASCSAAATSATSCRSIRAARSSSASTRCVPSLAPDRPGRSAAAVQPLRWVSGALVPRRRSRNGGSSRMAVGDERLAADALRLCGLFGAADDAAIDTLVHVLRVRRFRRGETIFHQGDPGDALFVVSTRLGQGRPAERRGRGAGDRRDPRTGRVLRRARDPRRRPALGDDRRGRGDRDARPPSRRSSSSLIDTDPGIRRTLLASLAAEIRRLTGHVEDLHFLDLPGRLASRIVRLAETSGATGPDGATAIAVAVHPVRAGRDDRRLAPVREPAARGPGRPGARPPRARPARRRRPSSGSPRTIER